MRSNTIEYIISSDGYKPWFAWYPVRVTVHQQPWKYQWTWWEWLETKQCGEWGAGWWHSYRFPGSSVNERGGLY